MLRIDKMAATTEVNFDDINNFADEILSKLEKQSSQRLSNSNMTHDGCCLGNTDADDNTNSNEIDDDVTTSSIEDDLEIVDKMNVAYDFSVWDSFRTSLSSEKQMKLKQSFANSRKLSFAEKIMGSFLEEDDESSDDEEDIFARLGTFSEEGEEEDCNAGPEIAKTSTASHLELTEEERYDNAAWRMRLESDQTFSRNYIPQNWETKEMESIIDFLGLLNPGLHSEYLNKQHQITTRNAISKIFFPQAHGSCEEQQQPQSVLLKRGPVLLDGEERELMLFTHGFVISRIELDTLVNLLLDASSGRTTSHRRYSRLNSVEIVDRFQEIDTDQSGQLDRTEIRNFFRSLGISLTNSTLDNLMTRFDTDSDGTISLDEFKAIMEELQGTKQDGQNFWQGLGQKIKSVMSNKGVTRKLEVAFQMSDIDSVEKVEKLIENDKHMRRYVGKGLASLCIAVNLKNMKEPMIIVCSKPDHVDAWVEAFNICHVWGLENIDWAGSSELQKEETPPLAVQSDWRCSTIDWGLGDDEVEDLTFSKSDVDQFKCSAVDWT